MEQKYGDGKKGKNWKLYKQDTLDGLQDQKNAHPNISSWKRQRQNKSVQMQVTEQ